MDEVTGKLMGIVMTLVFALTLYISSIDWTEAYYYKNNYNKTIKSSFLMESAVYNPNTRNFDMVLKSEDLVVKKSCNMKLPEGVALETWVNVKGGESFFGEKQQTVKLEGPTCLRIGAAALYEEEKKQEALKQENEAPKKKIMTSKRSYYVMN